MRDVIPRGVQVKGGRYYLVTADGKKRIWHRLCRVEKGLPELYTTLAAKRLELARPAGAADNMAALISAWETEVMPAHADTTKRDERAYGRVIADAFVEFQTVAEIETPDCSAFLAQFKTKPRTFNAYRGQLREYFRFAEEKGKRPAGSNPIQSIRTMRLAPRGRYITDSELRRIKVAALRWNAGKEDLDTRSGPMLCALIDMAYLTGQAIGDLLKLEWKHLGRDGISFARGKVEKTTGSKVLIGWTPKLRDVERRLRALRIDRRAFGVMVFVRQDGQPYTYWGASSAWRRARDRAGIKGCTFHDLKAKALTDKEAREGMRAAQAMGQHATESQTVTYVRRRSGRKTDATR